MTSDLRFKRALQESAVVVGVLLRSEVLGNQSHVGSEELVFKVKERGM